MSGTVAEEYCGSPAKRKNVFVIQNDKLVKFKNGRRRNQYTLGSFFYEVFFPEGYPDSVSRDYLSYQIFDTIQAFCSSVNGTIATQSILQGLGVGEEATTALAATLTWVLKDGVGMIGRIVFAWAQGTDLDCDLKRWRFRADVLNDVAMFLDVCSASSKRYFVLIVCFSALLKSVVGIAGVGTRPAVIQHQARRNNIGDVAAKDSSQETLVNLAALVTSLLVMPMIAPSVCYLGPEDFLFKLDQLSFALCITKFHFTLSWLAFFFLASIHIAANYFCVRSLSLETFNQSRFHLAVTSFLSSGGTLVASIRDVNLGEPVILSLNRPWRYDVGARLPKGTMCSQAFHAMREIYSAEVFCFYPNKRKGIISIFLSPVSTQDDVIRAAFEAEVTAHKLRTRFADEATVLETMRETRAEMDGLFGRFRKLAEFKGWDFSRNYLGVKECRVMWRNPGVHDEDLVTL